MSHMLNIPVPDMLYETLTKTARETGQPLETVAAKWLAAAARQFASDPLESFIGAFDSGGTDWADNHDQRIADALNQLYATEASHLDPSLAAAQARSLPKDER